MKLRIFILCPLIALILISCKSNKQKAEDLIRTELSKTLLDFNSYEPIETTVAEAYENAYNNPWCFQQAMTISECIERSKEYSDAISEARERMDIWGAPSYYSSSYSDNQYYKYKEQFKDNLGKLDNELAMIRILGQALQDSIKNLDSEKIIGWEVTHRFRCKTRGGQATIVDYRYIVDAHFKNILFREDMDDEDYSDARGFIALAEQNGFDREDL